MSRCVARGFVFYQSVYLWTSRVTFVLSQFVFRVGWFFIASWLRRAFRFSSIRTVAASVAYRDATSNFIVRTVYDSDAFAERSLPGLVEFFGFAYTLHPSGNVSHGLATV